MAHPERIVADETSAGILAIHLKRYEFARALCTGRKVLDAACGVGYGTSFLAAEASSIVGVDISDETIDYARRRYAAPNIEFVVADVNQLPFADGTFDVVCSFETIEHVADPAGAVAEAARVLRPSGVYIASTPKADRTTHSPANPFHTVEFSPDDFTKLLGRHFGEVQLYGQRRLQTRRHQALQRLDVLGLRRRLGLRLVGAAARAAGTPSTADQDMNDLVIDHDLAKAVDLVALCCRPAL